LCAHRHPSKIDPRRVSVMFVGDVSQKANCGLNILALRDHALIEIGERRVEAGIVHPMSANARLWGQDQDRLKPLAGVREQMVNALIKLAEIVIATTSTAMQHQNYRQSL